MRASNSSVDIRSSTPRSKLYATCLRSVETRVHAECPSSLALRFRMVAVMRIGRTPPTPGRREGKPEHLRHHRPLRVKLWCLLRVEINAALPSHNPLSRSTSACLFLRARTHVVCERPGRNEPVHACVRSAGWALVSCGKHAALLSLHLKWSQPAALPPLGEGVGPLGQVPLLAGLPVGSVGSVPAWRVDIARAAAREGRRRT